MTSCVCLTFFLLSLSAHAEDKPSVESFFGDPEIYSAVISPKGEHVALLTRATDGGRVIIVRDTANPENVRVVAGLSDNQIREVHWVNENRIVFTFRPVLYDVLGGNYDEMAVDLDGKNQRHLISGDFGFRQDGVGSSIHSKTLTSEYQFVSSVSDGSDDIIIRQNSWKLTDPYHAESNHLFRLNTRTQELKDIPVGKSPASVKDWILDGHDVPRLALASAGGHCITYYRAAAEAEWEVLADTGCHERQFRPIAFDGDDTLIGVASPRGYDALTRYDLTTRKLADQPFLSVDGFDFAGSIEVDSVTHRMVGIHYLSDAESTVWVNANYKQMQAKIDAMLPQTVNRLSCGADCLHAPSVLVTASSDRRPEQFYLYDVARQSLIGLGSSRPQIKPAQMGLRDFYRFKSRDGMSIPVYVTTPPGKPAQPLPAIVLVHGGPWVRGWSWEWDSEAQFLASRGYLVIQPEFRGSTGFGYNLFHAGWKQWGQAMQDDLADAALWAVHEHNADPKRIAIMGASYGGYATLMGLIKNPEIFHCGVEWAGVTDSGLMFSLAQSDISEDGKKYDWGMMIGDPMADAEMFKKYSPLENAAKLTQPLLIAHGAEDRRVPIAQAIAFHDAVKKTNPNVDWVVYDYEYHGWHLEKDKIDFWKRVDAFLDKNLMHAQ